MSITTLEKLKSYFKTGAKPTQEQFHALLDSYIHKDEDTSYILQGLAGATFMGVATPDSIPPVPTQKVFYIANEVGVYPNYGGFTLEVGEIAFFTYNGSWSKITISTIAQELGDREDVTVSQKCVSDKLAELESEIIGLKLKPGINLYNLQKGQSYIIKNDGQNTTNVGYYVSIDDANNDNNYHFLTSMKGGATFEFDALEDAPVVYTSIGVENAKCTIINRNSTAYKIESVSTPEFKRQFSAITSDRETIFKTKQVGQYWINGDTGELKESANYKSFTYRIGDRYKDAYIKVTAGAAFLNEASIAFYSSDVPSVESCIKLELPTTEGVNNFELKIPTETKVMVVSTRLYAYPEESVKVFLDSALTDLQDHTYAITPKAVAITSNYIDAQSGALGYSKNYKAFTYIVNDSYCYATLYVKTGANNTSDASIAFYGGDVPSDSNCIKTIGANDGINEYIETIPIGAKSIVVSTRISVYDGESVKIESDKPLTPIFERTSNIRVISYNSGDYSGIGFANGDENSKKAYRKILAHNLPTLIGVQADVSNFGEHTAKDKIWGMFRYYEQRGEKAFNYKAFASDFPVYGVNKQFFAGATFDHDYFLIGFVNLKGIEILVISFHLDWRDKAVRALQYQQIIDFASHYKNVIAMGDTNCENYENGILIDNKVLIDEWNIFVENGYNIANNGYFGLFDTYAGSGGEPIDNIFVKGSITINNFEVIKEDWMNDHYMVVTDLTVS